MLVSRGAYIRGGLIFGILRYMAFLVSFCILATHLEIDMTWSYWISVVITVDSSFIIV